MFSVGHNVYRHQLYIKPNARVIPFESSSPVPYLHNAKPLKPSSTPRLARSAIQFCARTFPASQKTPCTP